MSGELDDYPALFREWGEKLDTASHSYFAMNLAEFIDSQGKISERRNKRLAKRLKPVFNQVAEAAEMFRACRNTVLQICSEQGQDWQSVCNSDPELAMWEERNRDYFDVTSDEDVYEVVSRWRPGPPPS